MAIKPSAEGKTSGRDMNGLSMKKELRYRLAIGLVLYTILKT